MGEVIVASDKQEVLKAFCQKHLPAVNTLELEFMKIVDALSEIKPPNADLNQVVD